MIIATRFGKILIFFTEIPPPNGRLGSNIYFYFIFHTDFRHEHVHCPEMNIPVGWKTNSNTLFQRKKSVTKVLRLYIIFQHNLLLNRCQKMFLLSKLKTIWKDLKIIFLLLISQTNFRPF